MPRTKKVAETETTKVVETTETAEVAEKKVKKYPIHKNWNNPTPGDKSKNYEMNDIGVHRMYVEIMILENALGTLPNSEELMREYIASQSPDANTIKDEIDAVGEAEVMSKQITVYPRGFFKPAPNNKFIDIMDAREGVHGENKFADKELVKKPFIYDYQVRGFFKDSCGLLIRGGAKYSSAVKAYKKVIDGNIFVHPRRIAWNLPEFYFNDEGKKIEVNPENLKVFQRPLRTSGPSGERSAIAASEELPAGSSCKFYIEYLDPKMHDLIVEWLNYGCMHGLGAWRNSGRGIFIWRELKEDYSDYSNETDEE